MEKNFRHEYKYLISRSSAELLKVRLKGLMRHDPHTGPTGRYTIRSLYFDDLTADAFYDKVSGVDNRSKYRIRCYNYSNSIFKLEKKEKKGHLTRKTGQKLTLSQVQAIQENPRKYHVIPSVAEGSTTSGLDGKQKIPPLPSVGRNDSLLEELRLFCCSKGGRPMVLVDYDRTPFVCADGNTRITIDENLRTLPYRGDLFASSDAMIPVMEPEQVILEVKFDDFLPGHLNDCLADIPKAPMAISKFAMCMNLL